MKKIALILTACLGIAGGAFAGQPVRDYKTDKNPPAPCFKDQELQLDVFGLYGWSTQGPTGDGFGGGLGLNYFFLRHFGFGVDGSVRDASDGARRGDVLWTASASLIARCPLELGSICIAPYFLGGGGVQSNDTTNGTGHAGGGLEWRATPKIGIFTEGRYIWAGHEDQVQARFGARIVF